MKHLSELEAEFADFLADAKTLEKKQEKCQAAILTLIYDDRSDPEYFSFCR